MATKIEIDKALARLKEAAVAAGQSQVEVDSWTVLFMPNQAWAMCRVNPDDRAQWELMYLLGDTKGEALDYIRAMLTGLALTATRS